MKDLDRLNKWGWLLLIQLFAFGLFAQEREEVYGTNTGQLKMTAIVADTVFRASSDELTVILNYQTAEFKLILDIANLRTENDSLNNLLEKRRGEKITFTGNINLPYIKREKHPPKGIEISGYLSTDPDQNEIMGKGRLEYLFNGRYASMLTMNFMLNVDEIGVKIPLPNLANEIEVELRQAVLNKPIN